MGEICMVENLGKSVAMGDSEQLKNALTRSREGQGLNWTRNGIWTFKIEYVKNFENLLGD